MSAAITDVHARQVVDSRGNPTVEVDVHLGNGGFGRAAVPSGASTGAYEAVELRDGGSGWLGRGVLKAVAGVVEEIKPALLGLDATDQRGIDRVLVDLDGTPSKSRLGANALLGCSLAAAKAAADGAGQPLYAWIGGSGAGVMPVPLMNVINGGAHAQNSLDLQEFMVVPAGADSFSEAVRIGAEVFHQLRMLLRGRGLVTAVGDEGGFAPNLESSDAAVSAILAAADRAGHLDRVAIALDAAASEVWRDGSYRLEGEGVTLDPDGLIALYTSLADRYPVVSIEDGLAEEEWESWTALTRQLGSRLQLVGDDLFVTNTDRLQQGIERGVANAILVKVNQIGTLSETLDAIELARRHGYAAVISHRSGETEDTTIADLAVAVGAGQIKTGAPSRTDRVAKYNQLLRIEEELGSRASFPGWDAFPRAARG
ncbi:MAG: phosphopyruvate hydratase [Actinomycetia bacterium]|nr:phosphopyruvate hydratase [Actinomycetes bacterium]